MFRLYDKMNELYADLNKSALSSYFYELDYGDCLDVRNYAQLLLTYVEPKDVLNSSTKNFKEKVFEFTKFLSNTEDYICDEVEAWEKVYSALSKDDFYELVKYVLLNSLAKEEFDKIRQQENLSEQETDFLYKGFSMLGEESTYYESSRCW